METFSAHFDKKKKFEPIVNFFSKVFKEGRKTEEEKQNVDDDDDDDDDVDDDGSKNVKQKTSTSSSEQKCELKSYSIDPC